MTLRYIYIYAKKKKKKKIASIPSYFWALHSMSTKGTTLVNTRNLSTAATSAAQLINELNQDV